MQQTGRYITQHLTYWVYIYILAHRPLCHTIFWRDGISPDFLSIDHGFLQTSTHVRVEGLARFDGVKEGQVKKFTPHRPSEGKHNPPLWFRKSEISRKFTRHDRKRGCFNSDSGFFFQIIFCGISFSITYFPVRPSSGIIRPTNSFCKTCPPKVFFRVVGNLHKPTPKWHL